MAGKPRFGLLEGSAEADGDGLVGVRNKVAVGVYRGLNVPTASSLTSLPLA
jgi:hypothetical protein